MKKLKVLMMSGMLAAGICLFAACGTANDDGTNNGVNDTSNTQVTTQENIPGTDNTTSVEAVFDWRKWQKEEFYPDCAASVTVMDFSL